MGRYDYRTNDLLGAARYAAIYADGFDTADEPSPSELYEDEIGYPTCRNDAGWPTPPDPELLAVLDEVYGPASVVADLPF